MSRLHLTVLRDSTFLCTVFAEVLPLADCSERQRARDRIPCGDLCSQGRAVRRHLGEPVTDHHRTTFLTPGQIAQLETLFATRPVSPEAPATTPEEVPAAPTKAAKPVIRWRTRTRIKWRTRTKVVTRVRRVRPRPHQLSEEELADCLIEICRRSAAHQTAAELRAVLNGVLRRAEARR